MPYNRKLIDYVPPYYDELLESTELLSAEDVEFARLNASIDDLLLQFNVSTATWGLREWERILGITPPVGATTEMRRARILAKLRGAAPATYANMLAIINAHLPNKDANLIELPKPGVVSVEIPLSGNIDLVAVSDDINTYKPAHLQFEMNGIISDTVELIGKEYSFGVPYLICGEFTTDNAKGHGAIDNYGIDVLEYEFDVPYLICGEFSAEEAM